MKNLQTRKIIALSMTLAYIGLTVYATIAGKEVPVAFITTAGTVIGYYFGKSTALEIPKQEGKQWIL